MLGRRTVLAGALALPLSACALARVHPDVEELEALPDARLVYPGSVTLGYGGVEGDRKMGTNPASVKGRYAVDARGEEILGFFADHVPADGWSDYFADGREEWSDSRAWRRTDAFYDVGIATPEYAARVRGAFPAARGLRTIYEVELIGNSS